MISLNLIIHSNRLARNKEKNEKRLKRLVGKFLTFPAALDVQILYTKSTINELEIQFESIFVEN